MCHTQMNLYLANSLIFKLLNTSDHLRRKQLVMTALPHMQALCRVMTLFTLTVLKVSVDVKRHVYLPTYCASLHS